MTAYLLTMSYRKPFGLIFSTVVSLWLSGKTYGYLLILKRIFGIQKFEYDGFRPTEISLRFPGESTVAPNFSASQLLLYQHLINISAFDFRVPLSHPDCFETDTLVVSQPADVIGADEGDEFFVAFFLCG